MDKFKDIVHVGNKTYGWLAVSEAEISKNNVRQTPLTLSNVEPLEERLAKNIKEIGLQQLPVCDSNGRIYIGGRRVKAYLINGEPYIPVEIKDISPSEQKLASYSENKHRRDMTADEEGKILLQLLEENGLTITELAKKLGEPSLYIEDRIKIVKNLGTGRVVPYGTGLPQERKVLTFEKAKTIARDWIPKEGRERLLKQIETEGLTEHEVRKSVSIMKKAIELLSQKDEEVQEKVKKNLESKFWTPKLSMEEVDYELYKAEGASVPLSKITFPESQFKTQEEADSFAKQFSGRSNGLITVKRWELEIDKQAYLKWKNLQKVTEE